MASSADVWTPRDSVPIVTTDTSIVTEIFIAVAGQQVFTLSQFSYIADTGSLLVTKNGSMLDPFLDFDESSTTTFTLTTPAAAGDKILAIGFIGALNGVANTYYLGPAAVEPTVNARGEVLSASDEGVTYWNTATKDLWLYNGTAWILAASSSPTSANLVNISDTIGKYTGTEVETALSEVAVLTAQAAVDTSSGYYKEFTIPSWLKEFELAFNGVSFTGVNNIVLYSTLATDTHVGACSATVAGTIKASDANGTYLSFGNVAAASLYYGRVRLTRVTNLLWIIESNITNTTEQWVSTGIITLSSGTLTSIRVADDGVTAAFDAGAITMIYKG